MWTVSVLGPVGLRRAGVPLAVPAGKTAELLIRLALDAGELVRTDRLIDDLWSSDGAGVARKTLQAKVSKLRRALGEPGLLTGGAAGYTLHIDPARVDALLADPRASRAVMRGREMTGWLRVDLGADPDPDAAADADLRRWVGEGVGFVRTLPPK